MKLKVFLYTVAAAICIVIGGFFFRTHIVSPSTSGIARAITQACAKTGADHSACYESEVPNLYPKLGVAQIFDIVRAIRVDDPSYQFCHVLGHKIGERVVSEDPNNWVDAIPLNPSDGLCSNGFIHGVIGGRFSAEVLDDATIQKFLPDFIRACAPHDAWHPSDLDRAICYHGMGHLFDFITNADIPKALGLCANVAPDNYSRVCIQGVFMQIYQPLEPDDYQLIAQMKVKPTKSTVRSFCATFKVPIYVGSCLEESWPMFQRSIFDGTGVRTFCSGQPDATETNMCYVSMSSIIGRMSLADPSAAALACGRFPADQQQTCYNFSAQAVLEEDLNDAKKALDLCRRASGAIADSCIQTLVDHANFTFGSKTEAYNQFCRAVPSQYKSQCVSNQSSH